MRHGQNRTPWTTGWELGAWAALWRCPLSAREHGPQARWALAHGGFSVPALTFRLLIGAKDTVNTYLM